jgi:hypothetical protein
VSVVGKVFPMAILTGKLDKILPFPAGAPFSTGKNPRSVTDQIKTAPENPKAVYNLEMTLLKNQTIWPIPAGGFSRRWRTMLVLHGVKTPWHNRGAKYYLASMNIFLLVVVLLLLFSGGGFYFGSPVIGGSGLCLILLISVVIWVMGGFRTTKR